MNRKEFDEKLNDYNVQELEEEFQNTRKFFENLKEKIKLEEVEEKFPAFYYIDYNEQILIKFPTYKIRVVNSKMSHKELAELLGSIGNYKIQEEPNVIMVPSFNPVKSTDIYCLETNLEKNMHMAEEIKRKLDEHNMYTERWVDCGYYHIPIELDEEGFITVLLKGKEY